MIGQRVQLNFLKQAHDGKKTEYDIDTVLAQEEVVIDYAGNFQLYADQALYRKELPRDYKSSKKEFQGIVSAYPKDEQSQCRLTHEGDEVYADMIDLDLINSKLSLLHPKGTLASAMIPHAQKGDLRFQADHLYWDQIKNTLTLKGQIAIEENSLGVLQAQDELQITQTFLKGKYLLKTIHTQGPSTLVCKDVHQGSHQLISSGSIDFNRDKLRSTIDSLEKEGIVPQDKQLYYEEEEFAVFADAASLEYSMASGIAPVYPPPRTQPSSPARCAITADRSIATPGWYIPPLIGNNPPSPRGR